MKSFLRNWLLLAILLTSLSIQSSAQDISSEKAKELVTKNSSFLKLSNVEIENSLVSNAYVDKTSGMQLIYLQQSYQGVPIFNSIQVIALKSDKAVNLSGNRIQNVEKMTMGMDAKPSVSAKQSVSNAARSVNMNLSDFAAASLSILKTSANNQIIEFAPSGISQENIVSQLLWVPDEVTGKLNLAWQVRILPPNSSDSWLVFIDAKNGVEISKVNMTLNCTWDSHEDRKMHAIHTNGLSKDISTPSLVNNKAAIVSSTYTVIPFGTESPTSGGFAQVANPWLLAGAGNNAGTLGWHNDGTMEYPITRGNNVWAKLDLPGNNNNLGAPATSTTSPNFSFNFPFDGDAATSTTNNRAAAITNLFYWNNIMHDLTYQYGFDEVSGNFQKDNLGRGGVGNDFVYADAQDGSGRSNANFSVTKDGVNGRMQMFLFDGVDKKLFKVNSPSSIQGYKNAIEGAFSTKNLLKNVGPVTGDLILYKDGSGNLNQGCSAPSNSVTGKIAVIDRGDCGFTNKAKNAQTAGAIAVIIVNNDALNPTAVIPMGGTDNTVLIPAVMISLSDGNILKNQLSNNVVVNVTLASNNINDLDGDLDNGIVAHEYGHGVSTRLTGGPAQNTCLNNKEQGGEGWSDYFALMVTTDWATATVNDGPKPRPMGTYVLGQDPVSGAGIRAYPYSTNMAVNPWTYDGVKTSGGEVHDIGEIWAATLWDMTWNIIQMDGINADLYNANGSGGNSVSMKLVMMGLKLQPCSPGFLDARDGILQADQQLYNGKYSCAIWNAFARRGMGVKAQQGNSSSTNDQTQNFDVPDGAIINKTVDKEDVSQNDILEYTFTVKSQCAPISNYKIVDTLAANVTYVSGGTYNAGNRTVTFNISSLGASDVSTFKFKVRVNKNTYFIENTIFSETVPTNAVPASLIATSNVPASQWTSTTLNHSAPYGLKSAVPNSASEQLLTSANSFAIVDNSELSFWHSYNTDANNDGGVVELSTDNGTNWFDAGPYMSLNGYNSTIVANTSLLGKQAFTGISGEILQTIIDLSSFKGKSIRFRLKFVTDAKVKSNGWFVDDIFIMKRAAVYNIATLFNGQLFASRSGIISSINAAVLPLSWGTFTAEKSGNIALLKWTTFQEVNTDKFIIERSTDGIHFNEIGTLNASGNASGISNYSTIDDSPLPGANNYRIKQTDLDGNYTYSEIKSLNFDLSSGLISISPNPSKGGMVTLKIAGNQGNLKVALLNTAGQVLNMFSVSKDKNDLMLPSLASGVYYLKITGANISSVQKLVIEK